MKRRRARGLFARTEGLFVLNIVREQRGGNQLGLDGRGRGATVADSSYFFAFASPDSASVTGAEEAPAERKKLKEKNDAGEEQTTHRSQQRYTRIQAQHTSNSNAPTLL